MNGKVVHQQIIVCVEDIGGLHLPGGVVEDDVRRLYAHMGLGLVHQVLVEFDDAVQLSAHVLVGAVVVP